MKNFWHCTGCFNKMYPILVLNFEKVKSLMSVCIISYKFRNLSVLFDTSNDEFHCIEAELHPFSKQLDFYNLKNL